MDLNFEIQKGENKRLEFKEMLPSGDSIAKTAVAFSNTSGGRLVIGVNDEREVVGLDIDDIFEVKDKVASIIFDRCYPNIIPDVYTKNIEGKLVLVIEIFRGNLLPYYLKNQGKNRGTYIRIGATNRKAGYENIVELERQRRNISFDEEIEYDVEFESIDIEFLDREFKRQGKEINTEKLLNMRLIKQEKGQIYPTKGLLIISGKSENARIKCSRFRGTTMRYFLDKKEYSGDIFDQIRQAEQFILNHINVRGEINGLIRNDIPEIPIEAIRESLVNAYVHRDYTNFGRDIKLGIYDDMINIVSPGAFPNTLLEEDIYSGRSEIRNKVVARIFKELGYIEQWGSGITRIKESCNEYKLKEPQIFEKNDFVEVEIFRESETVSESTGKYRKVPESTEKKCSVQEKMVIDYIIENGKITTRNVEGIFQVKGSMARRILRKMREKGLVQKSGSGKNTYYVLGNTT